MTLLLCSSPGERMRVSVGNLESGVAAVLSRWSECRYQHVNLRSSRPSQTSTTITRHLSTTNSYYSVLHLNVFTSVFTLDRTIICLIAVSLIKIAMPPLLQQGEDNIMAQVSAQSHILGVPVEVRGIIVAKVNLIVAHLLVLHS